MSIFEEYGAFNLSLGFKIIQVHHNLAIYLPFCFDSYAPTSGEGVVVGGWECILFFMRILLASASHFLVCKIPCELVVGFFPNLHGYIIGT